MLKKTKILALSSCLALLCSYLGTAFGSVSEKPAARIVSLSPSTTEILFALGAGEKVAGVTTYCENPAEAKLKPKVGGFTNHNLEAIAALQPDFVVLTPNGGSRATYKRLKELRVPVYSLPFYSFKDLFGAFETLGRLSGSSARADVLTRELRQTADQIQKAPAPAPASPLKAAYVTWRSPLILAGKGTMEDEMVRLAGAVNAASSSRVRYPRWSEEAFWDHDPDVILDASAFERETGDAQKEKQEALAFWSKFSSLKAVREGRVYLLSREVLPVPGPRTVSQIRVIAEIFSGTPAEKAEGYERLVF